MSLNPNDRQRYIDEFVASIEHGQRLVQGKGEFNRPILMKVEGVNAYLLVMADRIRIQKKDEKVFLNQGFKPNHDIPLSQISGVRLKKPTTMGSGYIQFLLAGADESQAADIRRDENVVFFKGPNEAEFEKIKAAVEMKISAPRIPDNGLRNPGYSQSQPRAISYIEELEQLAALRTKGVITEEEFAAKKRKILDI